MSVSGMLRYSTTSSTLGCAVRRKPALGRRYAFRPPRARRLLVAAVRGGKQAAATELPCVGSRHFSCFGTGAVIWLSDSPYDVVSVSTRLAAGGLALHIAALPAV